MKYAQYIMSLMIISNPYNVFASSPYHIIEQTSFDSNQKLNSRKIFLTETQYPLTEKVLSNYKICINGKEYNIYLNDSCLNGLKRNDQNIKANMEEILTDVSRLTPSPNTKGYTLSLKKEKFNFTPFFHRVH